MSMRRRFAFSLALAVGLGFFLSRILHAKPVQEKTPPPSEVVRAREFQLIDKRGKVRAILGFLKGDVGLTLFSKRPQNPTAGMAGISSGADGSQYLALILPDAQTAIELVVKPDGRAFIDMKNKKGKRRIIRP